MGGEGAEVTSTPANLACVRTRAAPQRPKSQHSFRILLPLGDLVSDNAARLGRHSRSTSNQNFRELPPAMPEPPAARHANAYSFDICCAV